MKEILDQEVPDGWELLRGSESRYFEEELANEACPTHLLYKANVKALARKNDCDDFLFLVAGIEKPYCVVHLTWSKETEPDWPWTTQFRDKDEFLKTWQEKLYK